MYVYNVFDVVDLERDVYGCNETIVETYGVYVGSVRYESLWFGGSCRLHEDVKGGKEGNNNF